MLQRLVPKLGIDLGFRQLCSKAAPTTFLERRVAVSSRRFSLEDLTHFAEITGDRNPIHLDRKAGQKFGFDRCIVHGALLNELVSGLIAKNLPNCVVVEQTLNFPNALFVGEEVKVLLELISQRKRFVSVRYSCESETNREVLNGEAKLFV